MAECNITTVPEYAGEALCTGDADAQRLAFCSYFGWLKDTFVPYINNTFVPKLGECIDWIGEQVTQVARDRDQVTEDRNFIASTLNAQYVGAWNATDNFLNKMVEYDGALWVGLLSAVGETPQRNDNWLFVNYISSFIEEFYIFVDTEFLDLNSVISIDHLPQVINSAEPISSIIWELKDVNDTVIWTKTTATIESVIFDYSGELENSTEYNIFVTIITGTLTKSVQKTVTTVDNFVEPIQPFGDSSRLFFVDVVDGQLIDKMGGFALSNQPIPTSIIENDSPYGVAHACVDWHIHNNSSVVEVASDFSSLSAWSYSIWVKRKNDRTEYSMPLQGGESSNHGLNYLLTLNKDNSLGVYVDGAYQIDISPIFPLDDIWHLVIIAGDSTGMVVYLDNGQILTSNTHHWTIPTNYFWDISGAGHENHVKTTGFSVWNRKLTQAEAKKLYDYNKGV